ncbi:hypothetical protein [Poriferisphaera sp. WC338]|uniref:hypothetical protein n=1 Tax=Poriferisphaera sp. WC338 TaxID=3425129 RepID=UPI003D81ADAE
MIFNPDWDWTYTEFMDTINKVRERAAHDAEFHSRCINTPHQAIEQTAGHPYTAHNIIFVDTVEEAKLYTDSQHTLTFILPTPS